MKSKKCISKILALALVIALTVSPFVGVSADDTTDGTSVSFVTETDGKITFSDDFESYTVFPPTDRVSGTDTQVGSSRWYIDVDSQMLVSAAVGLVKYGAAGTGTATVKNSGTVDYDALTDYEPTAWTNDNGVMQLRR